MKLKEVWGWLKWVIGAIGFFWAYGVIKDRFEKKTVDKQFKTAMNDIEKKRKKIKKDKENEKKNIKGLDHSGLVRYIKSKLRK